MQQVLALIKPRLLSFRNSGGQNGKRGRLALFGAIGSAFWIGIFIISYRVLNYFQGIKGFGDILAYKLLSMVILTFFSLLVFSAILTTLSKLYLSKDLMLVHSLPVSAETIFMARWIESTADSAWMVIVYTIPVFLSYGIVYEADFFFYINIILTLFPLCISASAVSALLVMFAVMILPASRVRSIFVFLGIVVMIVLYVTFRMLRPERLVDPDAFTSVMAYLQSLSTPASPLLPTTWAYDSLQAALTAQAGSAMFHNGLAWSFAGLILFVQLLFARAVYYNGFSKTQAAMVRLYETQGQLLYRVFAFMPGPARAFVIKELKTFWRDQTQWSQLFLIAALIVIYLYNFSALPLDKSPIKTIYLQNLFSFLNMALAAFVLTAITARFAFPSVSIEGSSFWIVRSSPIKIRTLLWIKFFIYLAPLMVLSEILIVATNILLDVTPFMMVLSVITLFLMTPGIISLGIGLGAAYPDFTSENPAQTVTGFGGLMFMIYSAGFIGLVTILQAGPVYSIFMAGIRNQSISSFQWTWICLSFALVVLICGLALLLPMRFGIARLSALSAGKL
jgi:ABC-2 type transport system permease protein